MFILGNRIDVNISQGSEMNEVGLKVNFKKIYECLDGVNNITKIIY